MLGLVYLKQLKTVIIEAKPILVPRLSGPIKHHIMDTYQQIHLINSVNGQKL